MFHNDATVNFAIKVDSLHYTYEWITFIADRGQGLQGVCVVVSEEVRSDLSVIAAWTKAKVPKKGNTTTIRCPTSFKKRRLRC